MARIRSIKPDFWESEDTATLPMCAALTYSGLWNYSDDEGRGRFQPSILFSKLHGLRPDCSPQKVRAALDLLIERKLIVLYESTAYGTLYYIPTFKKHQHPDKPQPSKYPIPPLLVGERSGSVPVPEAERSPLGEERRMEGSMDRKGEGGNPFPLMAAPEGPGEDAQVAESVSRYAAWGHPTPEKKTEGVRELRALGLSHDYIRNGAQVNKPADVGFWDIIKALKAAGGKRPTRKAHVPGEQTRENAGAYRAPEGPTRDEREAARQKRDQAIAKADEILNALDEDELGGMQRDAEAEAVKTKVTPMLREAWIKSYLRTKIAKDHGIEGI